MNYVYSTLSSTNVYPVYKKEASGNSTSLRDIRINGGANVLQKVDGALITPKGAVTPVSDEDLESLQKDPTFRLHMQNGYITIDRKDKSINKAIETMEKRDNSTPYTAEDMKNPSLRKNKTFQKELKDAKE
jgi:hypothetical protein